MRASGASFGLEGSPGKSRRTAAIRRIAAEGVGDPGEVGSRVRLPAMKRPRRRIARLHPEEERGLVAGAIWKSGEEKEDEEIVDGEDSSIAYPARYCTLAAGKRVMDEDGEGEAAAIQRVVVARAVRWGERARRACRRA